MVAVFLIATFCLSRNAESPQLRRPEDRPGQRAIATLGTLGGMEVDETRPDRPVIKLFLRGRRVNDATLDLLGELTESP